jgi:hypothetical protein
MGCTKCGQVKPLLDFSPSPKHRNGRFPWCKSCKSAYQTRILNTIPKAERAAKYAEYRDKRNADRKARARFLQRGSAYSLKRRYGITDHQVVELAAYQGEVCAICGVTPDMTKRWGGLHIDHDHKTKKVRGLTCSKCNSGLGFFKDDPVLLAAAIEYIKSPPACRVVFTEEPARPVFAQRLRAGPVPNPERQAVLKLTCKQCGGILHRKAADEFAIRSRGKEGPFCSQKCAGTWAQKQQTVTGLIHGTTNGYTGYKCRCAECRRAHTEAENIRRARLRHKQLDNT